MANLNVPAEFWSASPSPLGVLERWRAATGDFVVAGQPIAEVRIEDGLYELRAPWTGLLFTFAEANDLVAPGVVIGRIEKPAVH
jgi:hypothetical protein